MHPSLIWWLIKVSRAHHSNAESESGSDPSVGLPAEVRQRYIMAASTEAAVLAAHSEILYGLMQRRVIRIKSDFHLEESCPTLQLSGHAVRGSSSWGACCCLSESLNV